MPLAFMIAIEQQYEATLSGDGTAVLLPVSNRLPPATLPSRGLAWLYPTPSQVVAAGGAVPAVRAFARDPNIVASEITISR
jgi:hypothetical protein